MAVGKDGQLLFIVPNKNLVILRMGDNPISDSFNDDLWEKVNAIFVSTAVDDFNSSKSDIHTFPNPSNDFLQIDFRGNMPAHFQLTLFNTLGQAVMKGENVTKLDVTALDASVYFLEIDIAGKRNIKRVLIH